MKKITKEIFVAFDGTEFPTQTACRDHEMGKLDARLAGLTTEQIAAAFARDDVDLADAIEAAGERCKRARLDAGDLRRRPKEAAPAAVGAPTQPVDGVNATPPAAEPEREAA